LLTEHDGPTTDITLGFEQFEAGCDHFNLQPEVVANITLSEYRQVPDLIQASTRRAVD
jgi:hypothetical protein